MKPNLINWLIKALKVDTNEISDGYHTFGELYEHRIELWIAFCKRNHDNSWRSKRHSDGSEMPGWFVLGYGVQEGKQMTYHLPMKYWKRLDGVIKRYSKAPKWDGHTAADVIERLKNRFWNNR